MSVGTGWTQPWGSLGGRAEAPWREARAWQHRGRGGWIRPFQPDESSAESGDGCRGGEDRQLYEGSSMAHTQPLQPLPGALS